MGTPSENFRFDKVFKEQLGGWAKREAAIGNENSECEAPKRDSPLTILRKA